MAFLQWQARTPGCQDPTHRLPWYRVILKGSREQATVRFHSANQANASVS